MIKPRVRTYGKSFNNRPPGHLKEGGSLLEDLPYIYKTLLADMNTPFSLCPHSLRLGLMPFQNNNFLE